MADLEQKRRAEQRLVAKMVALYCRGRHRAGGAELCPDCARLLDYAHERIWLCPRVREKTFCSKCPTPCYRPDRRQEIRQVMRYAGPRLLLRHPWLVIGHLLAPRQEKAPYRGAGGENREGRG